MRSIPNGTTPSRPESRPEALIVGRRLSAMPERQVLRGESGPSRRPPQTGEAARIPEQTARRVSGRSHFRLRARFSSVWHQHGFSLGRGCTAGESGFRGLQPPRVRCPMSGHGEPLPPDRGAGGGPGNSVGSSAADHPDGPHASARIARRAEMISPNASAPAPRRMISLRA
jgi:hypothetical protein